MDFRKEIEKQLLPLFESKKCAILDAPSYSNAGDQLIWSGMEAFLANNGIDCVYRSTDATFALRKLSSDTVVCLVGGGNFGDLWQGSQDLKNRIVEAYLNNRVVVFPQSVCYEDLSLCERDSAIFAEHKDLYICARDKESFAFMQKHFKNRVLLVPDMVLYLSFDKRVSDARHKTLFMMRTDKEATKYDNIVKEGMEVLDWPTHKPIEESKINSFMNEQAWPHRLLRIGLRLKLSNRLLRAIYRTASCKLLNTIRNTNLPVAEKWELTQLELNYLMYLNRKHTGALNEIVNAMLFEIYMPLTSEYAVDFISKYDEVYSTRLHGGVLAMLLGKKVHMIDNSYGKISALYNTWLTNEPNIEMVQQ